MLNFKLTPQEATYISALIAERPIKEAGALAWKWETQGNAEQARIESEERARIIAEAKVEQGSGQE